MVRTRRSNPEPRKACPICNHDFPISCLLDHASNCTGQNRRKTPDSTPDSTPGSTNFLFQTPENDKNKNLKDSFEETTLTNNHFEKVNSDFQEKLSFKLKKSSSSRSENTLENPKRSKRSKKSNQKSTSVYQFKEYRPIPSETESESSQKSIVKIDENTIQTIIKSSQVPKNQENHENNLIQAQTPINIDKLNDKICVQTLCVQTTPSSQIIHERKKILKPSHSVHFEVQKNNN